jgi:hypothetical protein
VLEQQLQSQFPNQTVEVINFGCSGYGTAHELITLRQKVWQYSPDIVLLAFLTGNDVTDNHRLLKRTPMAPYFTAGESESLVLDDSFKYCREYRLQSTLHSLGMRELFNACRCLQLANQARRAYATSRAMAARAAPETSNKTQSSELGLDDLIYLPPADETWRDAWGITERLIETMHQEVREHGAQFVLTTLSNGPQVLPNNSDRAALAKRLGLPDLFYPDRRLRDFAESGAIPVVMLAPRLSDYATAKQVFLHGFENSGLGIGHWNTTGHRVAGRLIAQDMQAVLRQINRPNVAQREKSTLSF